MTLLLLLFGTISDVFVVRATWPIVRYKNGTVGVKNDGGTVKVQSTDLIVDGNLSVSGSLFIQDRDLAEYEDRVSSLECSQCKLRIRRRQQLSLASGCIILERISWKSVPKQRLANS